VLAVLHARIAQRTGESLMGLAGPLTGMLVLPYEGAAAARRELRRPAPPSAARSHETERTDPIRAAGIRLTYRTARVLSVIAEHPGASNREVGSLAGINDQGQISRLLGRLERVGMIANQSRTLHRGERNSWALTPAGERAANSMRATVGSDHDPPQGLVIDHPGRERTNEV
jgi:DNA-binding MarR family transcriptional regulator